MPTLATLNIQGDGGRSVFWPGAFFSQIEGALIPCLEGATSCPVAYHDVDPDDNIQKLEGGVLTSM